MNETFDELVCYYPIPDREMQWTLFQTKSLQHLGELYVITQDGYLTLLDNCARLLLEDNVVIDMALRYGLRINGQSANLPLNKDIIFYNSDEIGRWWEYRAIFLKGELIRIERTMEHWKEKRKLEESECPERT